MDKAKRAFAVLFVLCVAAASASGQSPGNAIPVEPITAILDEFGTHSIVALADAHGNDQNHAFRLALIRDPRFAQTVNDIVVELGNARYQDLVDRFISGQDVPYAELRKAWQDTTISTAGNNYLMMQEIFETVRSVNAKASREHQIRILLGDPPIDWDNVRTREDVQKWFAMRDSFPAAVIQLEVLAKQRRALVLYGQLHFQRRNLFNNYEMSDWRAQTIVSLIEAATPTKVFTIWQHDLQNLPVDPQRWSVPSLVRVRGTELGTVDFTAYQPSPPARFRAVDGTMREIPQQEWQSLRTEDQLDAVLYLGPAASMTDKRSFEIPPALCVEPGFLETQLKRMALAAPRVEADLLKKYCAAYAKRQ